MISREKTCILLTYEYPYITSEPFLEEEIEYLKSAFKEIYIFPANASSTDKMTRNIPENSRAFPINCIRSKKRYPVYALKGLVCKHPELRVNTLHLKRFISSVYERGRSNYIFEQIKDVIEKQNLSVSDVVIYSYWFSDLAIAGWQLKEYLMSRGSAVKAISRGHGYDIYWERSKFAYLPYQNKSLEHLDGVYTCSENGRKYLACKYPEMEEKLHVARLGTHDYGASQCNVRNTFITCCSLKKVKRISLFAEAFSILAGEVPECKWICIGDGEELEQIQEIVKSNRITHCVHFLGRLTNSEVLEFYINNPVSFFCNVSALEGVPVSIMEAMSFGIPVIATNVGGNGELVNDECGFLLPSNITAQELAEKLKTAAELPEEVYEKKRREARNVWEKLSSAENNYSNWCNTILN